MPMLKQTPAKPEFSALLQHQLHNLRQRSSAAIVGLGFDLCHSQRIARLHQRYGARFAARILSPAERLIFAERWQHNESKALAFLASRFAAKEALGKALGTGIRGAYGFQSASFLNHASGQPYCQAHGALAEFFQQSSIRVHISLSDEGDWVAAVCLLEALPPAQVLG